MVLGQLPLTKIAPKPNPNPNSSPGSNPNQGQFPSGVIVWTPI